MSGVRIPTSLDSDGAEIFRIKVTRPGWHYEPRAIDFYTSTAASLYNRKHNGNGIDDGTDYADTVMKFYDGSGAEITQGEETVPQWQARLDANCVKTVMDWQPVYEMDIIGAAVMIINPPVAPQRAYAWGVVAPDIPAEYGGSIPYMSGGWNLRFFSNPETVEIDGRGVKTMVYDPVYNSNKIRTVIKHDAGLKIGMQILFEHFKA